MSRNDARQLAATLTMPRVHLNGTSRSELQEQYETAYRAVNLALDLVGQNGPNGRDYYVVAGAWERARAEHEARLQKLRDVRDELLAIYDHLAG